MGRVGVGEIEGGGKEGTTFQNKRNSRRSIVIASLY